jgi:hypothetical protein
VDNCRCGLRGIGHQKSGNEQMVQANREGPQRAGKGEAVCSSKKFQVQKALQP